jgi:hypothetical protein
MEVASSGYVTEMHVEARHGAGTPDIMVGTARGAVPPFVDVHEVIELLATEAMLAATEVTLWGPSPTRHIDVSTCL